ncbi:MAG TPA: mechanosensitive ion channel domain-containing protein [archaeon]|nr:mechanosensitive ion channel domain-containing protein [archaeon]
MEDWIIIAAGMIGSVLLAALVFRIIRFKIRGSSKKTAPVFERYLFLSLEKPLYGWVLLIGLNMAVEYTAFRALEIRNVLFQLGVILLAMYSLLSILDAVIAWYWERLDLSYRAKVDTIVPVMRRILAVIILLVGAAMILGSIGIQTTPVLALFAIGGLAVALALQYPLSNFFSGILITLDRAIKVGDFVGLEGGAQGYVVSVGLGSTQIRTLAKNLVIIPNSKLAQSVTTNFSLPTTDTNVVIPYTVSYSTDPEKAEKAALEAAMHVQRTAKGTVPEAVPVVRFSALEKKGMLLSVVISVQERADKQAVVHEFIKEFHKRFLGKQAALYAKRKFGGGRK